MQTFVRPFVTTSFIKRSKSDDLIYSIENFAHCDVDLLWAQQEVCLDPFFGVTLNRLINCPQRN